MGALNHHQTAAVRCPACGNPQPADTPACTLCGFALGDKRVTGDDVTPYALAHAEGNPAWWRMCKWVWTATTERLKHLALMRSSPASRRFAAVNILLLAFATVVLQLATSGWQIVSAPVNPSVSPAAPAGKGWLHLTASRHTTAEAVAKRVDLWWNPARAIIASAAGLVATVLLSLLLLVVLRALIERLHRRSYRGEQRMTAALSYSTAWIVPALPAALVVAFLPLSRIGAVSRSAVVSDTAIMVIAAIIAALPAVLWWLWLVRLAATAPADTRGGVQGLFVVGAPLFAGVAIAAWWFGLRVVLEYVFMAMGLNF
jgi:hypothetical protein